MFFQYYNYPLMPQMQKAEDIYQEAYKNCTNSTCMARKLMPGFLICDYANETANNILHCTFILIVFWM